MAVRCGNDEGYFDFAQDDGKLETKTRIENFDPGFQMFPRRCRSGGSPVPISNGWMTVAPASDFQSRHVIFCDDLASWFLK